MNKSAQTFLKTLFVISCFGGSAFAQTVGTPGVLRLGTASTNIIPTTITHGSQLTTSMVGLAGLGITAGQLVTISGPSGKFWDIQAGMARPSFVPAGNYVYNNDPNNHGGTVPAGGMVIDGFTVPAGVWVSQFYNFKNDMYIHGTSGPGILFRGCRFRGTTRAPGWFNIAYNPPANTSFWFFYSDFGGLGPADNQYDESPLTMSYTTGTATLYRNYISYTTTAMNATGVEVEAIENYVEKITCYYCPNSPPGESTSKHLNGFQFMGGPTRALILRNRIVLQNPDDAGRKIDQTDAIMFNDSTGALLGAGTNSDGSVGYQIRDNLLGGGGYTVYAGAESGNSANVRNFVLTGNKITTIGTWPNGGSYGPIAHQPAWGTYGNVKSNNTFAESGAAW